jgi:uncharacterized protein YjiS (DUF1127 family)
MVRSPDTNELVSLPTTRAARFLLVIRRTAREVFRRLEARNQLRALSRLDDDLLRDIGLSRHDIERARARPFQGL